MKWQINYQSYGHASRSACLRQCPKHTDAMALYARQTSVTSAVDAEVGPKDDSQSITQLMLAVALSDAAGRHYRHLPREYVLR